MIQHVVQIIGDGNRGGGTTNVLALVQDIIRETGCRVTLITQRDSYALGRARDLGADVVGADFMRSRINIAAVGQLKEVVSAISPDIVHVHGARAGLPLSFALTKQRRFRVCYTLRGAHFVGKRQPMRYLAMLAERRCHAMAEASIFVSKHDLALCVGRGLLAADARRLVISNGIDPADFPDVKPSDPRLVTYLGRLSHEKQPEIVLRVARVMAEEGYRFQIIGDGPDAPRLHRIAGELGVQESVSFLGELSRHQALDRLNGSGALLLPSKWEGFPLAPIEAMALGVPTVAACVGGVPEVVEHGVTGMTVTGHAAEDYAAALRTVTADGELRRRLIAECRTRATARFSRGKVAADHLALYRELRERHH